MKPDVIGDEEVEVEEEVGFESGVGLGATGSFTCPTIFILRRRRITTTTATITRVTKVATASATTQNPGSRKADMFRNGKRERAR